jgi:hypothetical protein
MSNKKVYFLALVFSIIYTKSQAQGYGNSPYASIGIGELFPETVAAQDMMGGTGVSFGNSFYINQLNPALLAKNRTIGFNKYVTFNLGMTGAYKIQSQGDAVQDDFGMNLSNFSLVFPVKNKWAMGFSMRPFTTADFTMIREIDFAGSNISKIQQINSKGGISRVAFTNAINLAKGLYLGLEAQYNFGYIRKDTTESLSSSFNYQKFENRYDLKGGGLKAGLAYQHKISKKWNINAGAVYQIGSELKGESLRTFSLLSENGNGPAYSQQPDTIGVYSLTTSTPVNYKFGISLESNYHWVFAAEYGKTLWSGLNQFDVNAMKIMQDATEMNFGVEWMPNSSSSKYFNQVFYRLGFKRFETPYLINNTRVSDNSFSFGLSLPMGFRSPSYIDLALSLGRRGTLAGGLVQENYTKVSLNFSLLSSWFNKQRID